MDDDVGMAHHQFAALRTSLAEQLRAASAWQSGRDDRLATYRIASGAVMCRAKAGALTTETPVDALVCGTDQGCGGTWRCLSRQ